MGKTLSVSLKKTAPDKISFEISRDNFESFCNAVGLFKEDFLKLLRKSEADHRDGRITKRKSLYELIEKS